MELFENDLINVSKVLGVSYRYKYNNILDYSKILLSMIDEYLDKMKLRKSLSKLYNDDILIEGLIYTYQKFIFINITASNSNKLDKEYLNDLIDDINYYISIKISFYNKIENKYKSMDNIKKIMDFADNKISMVNTRELAKSWMEVLDNE